MPIQTQPLEVTDFSGGITENILQGDKRRYAVANNLWLATDKVLYTRDPIVPFSSDGYILPNSNNTRISAMFSVFSEEVLLSQSGRDIYTVLPGATSWSKIAGMNGNEALQGGDVNSQMTFGEFRNQLYVTSDGDEDDFGILPSKIYRDETDTWVARTAGLPRAFVPGNYTEATLLVRCIAVANALRTSFIAHMSDAKYTTSSLGGIAGLFQLANAGFLHLNVDQYSMAYLAAQTLLPGTSGGTLPVPLPTPRGNATDLASLLNLVEALNYAYTAHILDAKGSTSNASYVAYKSTSFAHYYSNDLYTPTTFQESVKGPHVQIDNLAKPTKIEEAAEMLNDLYQKWNWHRKSIFTHNLNNDFGSINKYAPTENAVGDVFLGNSAPTITPDWTDVFNYVNNVKWLYNQHVNYDGSYTTNPFPVAVHTRKNTQGRFPSTISFGSTSYNSLPLYCTLPDATNLDDAYLLTYWLRQLYHLHNADAGQTYFLPITFTTVLNSPNISAIVQLGVAGALTLTPGTWLVIPFSSSSGFVPSFSTNQGDVNGNGVCYVARVLSSAAGTAVLDRPITSAAGTLRIAQNTNSFYHMANDNTPLNVLQTAGDASSTALKISNTEVATDVNGWLTLAKDLFDNMAVHTIMNQYHLSEPLGIWTDLVTNVPYKNFLEATTAQVAYAFYFKHEYTVENGGIDYEVVGNPVFSDSTTVTPYLPRGYVPENQVNYTQSFANVYIALNSTPPESYSNIPYEVLTPRSTIISNIPVLTNTNNTNYDLTKIKVVICRTTNGGNTFYEVGEVDNGVTTFTDNVPDTIDENNVDPLIDREPLYTSGGVVGHDQPPVCKFVHTLKGTTYYGAGIDTGQFFPQRVWQSVQFSPDAVPATFYDDLDDDLRGLSSSRNNVIALCKTSIYRMEGGFNELGQGALTHDRISDTLGCVNTHSIVKTDIGVFFAGEDGFYYTDGYQVIKISLELDQTYQALTQSENQKRSIFGTYDKLNRRVYWAMKAYETDPDNSIAYVYYLDYGVKPSGTFTTISNGLNFRPSSLAFQNGTLFFGTERGIIMKTDPWNKQDYVIDITKSASQWLTMEVPWEYRSTAVDLGSVYNRKWITKIHLFGENIGNASVQINAIRDLNQQGQGAVPLAPVNYNENVVWGNPSCVWGDANAVWKTDGKLDVWRRFPATVLRSDFMQVQMVPANVAVYAYSVDYPQFSFAVVSNGAAGFKTVTIQTPTGFTAIVWPLDVVGYKLRTQLDEYTAEWTITAVAGNAITVADPLGTLPASGATLEWEIWGVKREQRFMLSGYVLQYGYLGTENQAYPGAKSNAGPGNGGQNP